jgi:hypothetical protein
VQGLRRGGGGGRVRRVAVVAALASVPAAGAPLASAAPPECRTAYLSPEFPSHARAGQAIEIAVSTAAVEEIMGTAQITVSGATETQTFPLVVEADGASEGSGGTITVPAPPRPNRATAITLSWVERSTWPTGAVARECSASATATIPVVPPGGKAGDPSRPRLEGRFRVFYRLTESGVPGVERSARAIWKLQPRCRYFACSTLVRSSAGLRGIFDTVTERDPYDYWLSENQGLFASCSGTTVNRLSGETVRRWRIRHAYRVIREIKLYATANPRTQQGRSFVGDAITHYEPIRSAKQRGCPDKYIAEEVFGRRIG